MPVTRASTRLLTSWRMFANESVSEGVLEPAYAQEVRTEAVDDVYRTLLATGQPWMAATDTFYLYERMQRWAGVTDTAVCLRRPAVNPMLDRRFLDIAASLPPQEKAASRFLAGLLCRLDPELGDIPMDGRKAPRAYVDPSWAERVTRRSSIVGKGYRKVRQRLDRSHRPPAGGVTLAELVVRHWRATPEVLTPALASGLLQEAWVDEVLSRCAGGRPQRRGVRDNARGGPVSDRLSRHVNAVGYGVRVVPSSHLLLVHWLPGAYVQSPIGA